MYINSFLYLNNYVFHYIYPVEGRNVTEVGFHGKIVISPILRLQYSITFHVYFEYLAIFLSK